MNFSDITKVFSFRGVTPQDQYVKNASEVVLKDVPYIWKWLWWCRYSFNNITYPWQKLDDLEKGKIFFIYLLN
jgi:hypothetical protein